jgi:type I restriction enzyme, S subunit
MSSYKQVSLKSITNNLDNRRIPLNGSQRAEKEGQVLYPYIGANNIMGYIDDYIFDEKILCVAEDGGSWGHNQKCASIYNEKVWVNNHAHVLTAKSNLILEYLMYYLNHHDLNLHITGATRGKLTKKSLDSIQIPLPPLPVQQKIAAILDAADLHRRKTKTLIEKYDQLTQSIFLEMFGDPVKNEKGWSFKKLVELVTKLGDGIHGTPVYSDDGEYYFINGNNLEKGKINFTDATKKVSKSEFLKHKRDLNRTTMLVSINGTIGRVAFYEDEKVMLGKSVCYFNLKTEELNPKFLFHIIQSNYFLNYAKSQATGSTIKNVSLKSMRNFPIPYPPLNLQLEFSKLMKNIEIQRFALLKSLQSSDNLFNTLLQRAFKGELVS